MSEAIENWVGIENYNLRILTTEIYCILVDNGLHFIIFHLKNGWVLSYLAHSLPMPLFNVKNKRMFSRCAFFCRMNPMKMVAKKGKRARVKSQQTALVQHQKKRNPGEFIMDFSRCKIVHLYKPYSNHPVMESEQFLMLIFVN